MIAKCNCCEWEYKQITEKVNAAKENDRVLFRVCEKCLMKAYHSSGSENSLKYNKARVKEEELKVKLLTELILLVKK